MLGGALGFGLASFIGLARVLGLACFVCLAGGFGAALFFGLPGQFGLARLLARLVGCACLLGAARFLGAAPLFGQPCFLGLAARRLSLLAGGFVGLALGFLARLLGLQPRLLLTLAFGLGFAFTRGGRFAFALCCGLALTLRRCCLFAVGRCFGLGLRRLRRPGRCQRGAVILGRQQVGDRPHNRAAGGVAPAGGNALESPPRQVSVNAGRELAEEAVEVFRVGRVLDLFPVDQLHLVREVRAARAERAR